MNCRARTFLGLGTVVVALLMQAAVFGGGVVGSETPKKTVRAKTSPLWPVASPATQGRNQITWRIRAEPGSRWVLVDSSSRPLATGVVPASGLTKVEFHGPSHTLPAALNARAVVLPPTR